MWGTCPIDPGVCATLPVRWYAVGALSANSTDNAVRAVSSPCTIPPMYGIGGWSRAFSAVMFAGLMNSESASAKKLPDAVTSPGASDDVCDAEEDATGTTGPTAAGAVELALGGEGAEAGRLRLVGVVDREGGRGRVDVGRNGARALLPRAGASLCEVAAHDCAAGT